MPRFLSTSFIALALFVGAAGAAPAAHAAGANGTPCDFNTESDGTWQNGKCISNGTSGFNNTSGTLDQNIKANQAADAVAANTATNNSQTADDAYNGIMIKIMSLFAWLVGVAALTLDYAVYYTVVTMGGYVSHLSAVGVTWRVLRDIGNIMLIFGFLMVGITTILNVDWYGGGKKMLPMMFVAAVFLNFSLFISEAIVDTGNLFATQFFTQINGGELPTKGPNGLLASASGVTLTTANEGISTKIMNQLGLQTIYGSGTVNTKIFEAGNPWIIGFFGIILFIVTAFVLFSLAFVLIARFVALVFLLIVAPIGFAGLAIPGFAARAKDWWTQLFHQTITAPILLLMLYIALTVITDAQFLSGFGMTTTSGGAATGFVDNLNLPGFASFILSFLVAMGLLIAVVIYAKRWSAFGGDWASKTAAKLSFGATAFGLRSTAGWGFQGASQALRRTKFGSTKYGRAVNVALDKGAKGSFDLRGTGVLKTIPFGSNIDAGKAQEGGYRKRQADSIKGHEEYVKSVEKAIEEGGIDSVIAAQEKRAIAERANKGTKGEYDAAAKKVEESKGKVKTLEEEKNKDKYWVTDPKNVQRMEAAQKELATDTQNLAAAGTKFTQTANAFREAEKAEKDANSVISDQKKTAKVAYAENIQGPFFGNSLLGWAAFGPGGASAAKNMIKDATKKETDAQKALKTLEKVIKDNAAESAPESKPEVAPAPAAGDGTH